MKYLIVGLGNIGSEYTNTRHNIGFDILNILAENEGLNFEEKRYGSVCTYRHKGRQFILLKPNTYMNLSGKSVHYWMTTEKIPLENVLILVDDLALPFGTLRIKPKGSDAGHNGLKNIQQTLGHNNYCRLRFGLGDNFPKGRQIEYVLGEWSKDEKDALKDRINIAIDMIKSFGTIGLQQTMTNFNNK
ncbi:MAG: aminoacyl-tRNA hydrolase [Marinilabiliaceae bacterium]|nr:aminoacyl-tRNA hydrolase [Marinilabiliaceae bacterium]